MQFQIFSDQPWYMWVLCIAGGIAFAFALYWRERKLKAAIPQKNLRIAISVLRAVTGAVLLFLLLDPYIKSSQNETEKPVVLFLQDNSTSIAEGIRDTAAYRTQWESLKKSLGDDFEVRSYVFGETLSDAESSITFTDASTNISAALQSAGALYEHLHLAGVILASDGIYNSGSNPVYEKNTFEAPIYTVALGDTTRKKDVRIMRARHNNLVYLNDRFVVEADVEAIFCTGAELRIRIEEVTENGVKSLGSSVVAAQDENFNTTWQWELRADAPGMRHYRITIDKISGEYTTDNNSWDLYVEVLDARQKILLLAHAPHPDVHALQQAIASNINYSVEVSTAEEWKGSTADHDLIILHQLPSAQYPVTTLLNEIKNRKVPVFFITGAETNMLSFNRVQNLVSITGNGASANEVTALIQNNFNLFSLDETSAQTFARLPALQAPYGQYTATPASQILAKQKIGAVATNNPLLVYSIPGAEKTAVLCGENFWKWRMYDYVLNKNHSATDGLISKTVQYLAAKEDKKQFRVSRARQVYNETERIVLDAELYNDSYELINTPDATITIRDASGKDFPFQFSKTSNSYTLQAGYFPEGSYTYIAQTLLNGKTLTDKGGFTVLPVRLETINSTANHQLMYQIAADAGGSMVYPDNLAALEESIRASAFAKPVLREVTRTQSVIHLVWIFILLMVFLAAEWFVRKYMGTY